MKSPDTQNRQTQSRTAAERATEGGEGSLEFVDNRPEALTQRRMADMMADSPIHTATQGAAEIMQRAENKTGMPDNLKSGIEALSGFDMSDVRVHRNSDKPVQLNAHAFAQGNQIHLGPGQEQHLPHEAWHVVQQKQGRVGPTMQMKAGVDVNDDVSLEREADVMGGRATSAGQRIEGAVGDKADSGGFFECTAGSTNWFSNQLSPDSGYEMIQRKIVTIKSDETVGKFANYFKNNKLYQVAPDQTLVIVSHGSPLGELVGANSETYTTKQIYDSTKEFLPGKDTVIILGCNTANSAAEYSKLVDEGVKVYGTTAKVNVTPNGSVFGLDPSAKGEIVNTDFTLNQSAVMTAYIDDRSGVD